MSTNKKAVEFYSTQSINRKDKESVLEALSSDFLSKGPKVEEFERRVGKLCKNNYVVSLNSATSALQLAYQVNGITRDSLVWTSPITFVATANAALHFEAKIDFVDINKDTLNICPTLLKQKLEFAGKLEALPDFLTVVHFGGNPCEMKKIYELSLKYGFKIIEDASHALGASYNGKMIGENNYCVASIFSFHPVKMITTGEGGALLLNSKKDLNKAYKLRSHGIETSNPRDRSSKPGWYYEQVSLGYNYRMSELQAALGSSQMQRLDTFVKKRNQLAKLYKTLLANFPLKFQKITSNSCSSYHLFTVEITDSKFKRDNLYNFLRANKIGCQVHYIPVHLQPFFKDKGFSKGMFKNAENYFQKCLSIPLHQQLRKSDINFVVKKLNEFFLTS